MEASSKISKESLGGQAIGSMTGFPMSSFKEGNVQSCENEAKDAMKTPAS
jgi:hypothetical protein